VPELLEIEYYRRLAERALHRRIAAVDAPDPWILKGGLSASRLQDALAGSTFLGADRQGKLLLLPTDAGPVLGLRFGMTGRLFVDGNPGVEELQYSSPRLEPKWERLRVRFTEGGSLVLTDPRRLGGVLLDPDRARLGPDALGITRSQLAAALAGSRAPIKARLLDQQRLSGVGNLLADETLWRASLDPARPAGSLNPAEVRRLHHHLRATLTELLERGGSHTGDLIAARERGGRCPRDATPLERRTIGGRTTYSCPRHQH